MSIYIEVKFGEIVEFVLLFGDFMCVKWIVEIFFENLVCYNDVWVMLGYMGMY